MQAAIETLALRREFGGTRAVDNVDLTVPLGSIYGFLGPNGAGKTTSIRMLTGLLKPTSGSIRVLGLSMPADRLRIARQIGALVETPSLYDHLSGSENLEIARLLLNLPRTAIDNALDQANLRDASDLRVSAYSLGMRQRLALARALLGNPKLLILDEPGNGLDPDGIRDLRTMLRRLAEESGITIFVSSHQLSEVQQIATHVGVMMGGRLLAQGPLRDVLSEALMRVDIRTDKIAQSEALIRRLHGHARREGEIVSIEVESPDESVPELVAALSAAGIRLFEVRCRAPSLEDLYVLLTRNAPAALTNFPIRS